MFMTGSSDPSVKEAGKVLMTGVFYEPEYRELCLQQLSSFNPDRMSLGKNIISIIIVASIINNEHHC